MDSHTLSRESVLERMTARNTDIIPIGVPDPVVTGIRNAVVGASGAVKIPR